MTERITCVLCGGDGYVSADTAESYGRYEGDTTCPSCDGKGKVPYITLQHNKKKKKKNDDWVCKCGDRNRKRWLYCHRSGCPRPF